MDQRLKNRLTRLETTAQYVRDEAATIDTVPLLRERSDEFLARQAQLPNPTPDTDRDNTVTVGEAEGATLRKQNQQAELAAHLVPMAAALYELRRDAKSPIYNPDKAPILDIRRPSALPKGAARTVVTLAEECLDLLEDLPVAALARFGLTADDVEAFREAAEAFGVQRLKPGAIRNRIATDLEALDDTLDELEEWIRTEYKRAARLLRRKKKEFLSGFNRAFRLNNRRATRQPKSSNDTPPTNPQ